MKRWFTFILGLLALSAFAYAPAPKLGLPTNGSAAAWQSVTSSTGTGNLFVPQTPEPFGYDRDGNLTNDGRWRYTWDAENRATAFTRISGAPSGANVKLDCQYDYRSRRTQKIVSAWNGSSYQPSTTNRFIYDGWNLVAILDGTNGLVQSFTWGSDASGTLQGAGGVGGLISMTVHQGTNAGTYFYCYDGNHNVAALVNAASGAVAGRYECDAFGNVLRATGALAFVNPFVFSTKFCDWETGFYYYGYRYYDPSAGRWLNRDSLGERGGQNLYGMVGNNAINNVDFLGLADIYYVTYEQMDNGISGGIPPGPLPYYTGGNLMERGLLNHIPNTVALVGNSFILGASKISEGIDIAGNRYLGSYWPAAQAFLAGEQGMLNALNYLGRYRTLKSLVKDSKLACIQKTAAESGVWSLGPGPRGLAIESQLGGNLPAGFRVIDRFENGVATSIKSIDLGAPTYQNAQALGSRLNGYVDSLAGWSGQTTPYAGVVIQPGQVTARALQVAVPPGGMSAAQQAVFNAAAQRAQGAGINFIVTPVP